MEKNINAIYQYTESVLISNDNSLNRLDTKFSAFIGFSAIFVRLSFDLSDDYIITKIIIGLLTLIAITICTSGLFAKNNGNVISPEELLSAKYVNKPNTYHQVIICKARIAAIKEYAQFMKNQQEKINKALSLFITGIFIYLSTIFQLEPLIKSFFHSFI